MTRDSFFVLYLTIGSILSWLFSNRIVLLVRASPAARGGPNRWFERAVETEWFVEIVIAVEWLPVLVGVLLAEVFERFEKKA